MLERSELQTRKPGRAMLMLRQVDINSERPPPVGRGRTRRLFTEADTLGSAGGEGGKGASGLGK